MKVAIHSYLPEIDINIGDSFSSIFHFKFLFSVFCSEIGDYSVVEVLGL